MDSCKVILGATGSVGSSLVRRLSTANQHVLAAGRDESKLARLKDETGCPTFPVDAHNPETIEAAVQHAAEQFGSVDGIANCMGTILLKPAHLTSFEEWQETVQVNLTSAFATVRAGANVMKRDGGSIVLVSSAAARIGLANHEAIAAAKAGIIGLTLSAAATYAKRNLRVNAVAPGLVKSEMTRSLWESEATAKQSRAMHALGRLGEPDEVASMIAWLLNPETQWVTGQVIGVDGGLASVVSRGKG